jgi:hypothetical protein
MASRRLAPPCSATLAAQLRRGASSETTQRRCFTECVGHVATSWLGPERHALEGRRWPIMCCGLPFGWASTSQGRDQGRIEGAHHQMGQQDDAARPLGCAQRRQNSRIATPMPGSSSSERRSYRRIFGYPCKAEVAESACASTAVYTEIIEPRQTPCQGPSGEVRNRPPRETRNCPFLL